MTEEEESRAAMKELFRPQVCVVDFHHARGPEVEFWVQEDGQRLFDKNESWSLLPFMALSDGAHAMVEEFEYFTLLDKRELTRREDKGKGKAVEEGGGEGKKVKVGEGDGSLFGIACTRQIRSDKLVRRSADVTRSSVQKSVVVVVGDARGLGELRTRLGIVTEMWFEQRDFGDVEILKEFQESLVVRAGQQAEGEREHYFGELRLIGIADSMLTWAGLSLREVIYEFRHQTLVLVKALLLQRKILFFGSKCERLCLLQFALLSLMPGLMAHLEDCAHPDLDAALPTLTEADMALPTTTSRASLLAHMGLPLRIFGKGAVLMPYAPLQHLDLLAAYETKSYVVGSTNSLLLQQKERYADLLVNLDEHNSITILSPSLRQALQLSAADRRWMDQITEKVIETWDEDNPSRPKGMGYQGSEEAIRLAFEEYILSLCSSMAYQRYREEVDGEKTSFDALSEAVRARRSMEKEKMRQEFDESALPDESEERPKTPDRLKLDTNVEPDKSIISSPPKKVDLLSQSYDPADNAVDFSPHFLTAWRDTLNCQRFLLSVQGKRIFEIVEPRHPTAGGFNIDDLNRRLAQNLGDLRKQYQVDERYAQAREKAGEALQAGRERWGKWWNDFEEKRRTSRGEPGRAFGSEVAEKENEKPPVAIIPAGATTTTTEATPRSSGEGGAGAGWSATIRGRAAKVQKPDTEAMQKAARENAAKAGLYLSSWGSWAKQKGAEWQKGGSSGKVEGGGSRGSG